MNPLFVIVGMPGAGKSTVVDHLAQRHWPVVYFGGITLAEVETRGLPATQDSERAVRESLRQLHGPAVYAKLSLPSIKRNLASGPTVIDGLYSWGEYVWLRQELEALVYVIAVCADRRSRYQRLASRQVRRLAPEDAEKRDFAEIENIGKGGPIAIADFTLLNNTSVEALLSQVDHLVDNVLEGHGQWEDENE